MQPSNQATGGQGRAAALGTSLFVVPERWGWEYVEAQPTEFDPGPEPEWYEPEPPDLDLLAAQREQAREQLPKRAAVTAGLTLLALIVLPAALALLALIAGVAWCVMPVALPTRRMKQIHQGWKRIARRHGRTSTRTASSVCAGSLSTINRRPNGWRRRLAGGPSPHSPGPAGSTSSVEPVTAGPVCWPRWAAVESVCTPVNATVPIHGLTGEAGNGVTTTAPASYPTYICSVSL